MRILFAVHQFFPNWYTGTERLVLNLSKQMQRQGHHVKVLTYGISEKEGFRHDMGFLVKEYDFQGVPVVSIRHVTIPNDIHTTIYYPAMEKIVGKIVAVEKCNVIQVCHPMRIGIVVRAARQRQIPVVMTLTDFWLICPKSIAVTQNGKPCMGPENGSKCLDKCAGTILEEELKQRFSELHDIAKSVDCFVAATKFLRRLYEYNNFPSDIKLIPYGEDYTNVRQNTQVYSATSEVTIGFLSTLTEHKGAHVLLRAFDMANMNNLRLKIYGDHFHDGDYYNLLRSMVRDPLRVRFYGAYKYEDMPGIMDGIDILVVPSIWWENSPLVLLRALAHNIPAIVSDFEGLTELVNNGENGFTFEAGNAESLAKVLKTIGENPTILNKIKTNIHRPPRIEEEAFEYERVYSNLTGHRTDK